MDLRLKGKKALVMASSTGLGKAIALRLQSEGALVAICSRDEEHLKKTAAEIHACYWSAFDLTQPNSTKSLIGKVQKEFGAIDILVTNSGGPSTGSFMQITTAQWQESFQSLWLSSVEAIQAVLPNMTSNRWGRILMITSIAAREPVPNLTLSNGLRAGILGLVKSMSNEVAKNGITINALLPGYIATDRLLQLGIPEEKLIQMIPSGRLGRPDEVADLASFLASERAGYITGQMIACDGGCLKGI